MTSEAVATLLELRSELPRLVGPEWEAIGPEIEELLDRLERADSDEEREALYDALIGRLYLYEDVRRVLLRSGERRGGGEVVYYERDAGAFANDEVYAEAALDDDDADGAGGGLEISDVIERTPHLELDAQQPIPVGSTFAVRVSLDTEAAHEGEHGTGAIVLPALSELQLRVWLIVSDHFEIRGDDVGTVTVWGEEPRSSEATFEVECVRAADGEAGITATFAYGIRPAGSVWRVVEVAGAPAPRADRELPEPAARVDVSAAQPDLVVQVVPDPDGDERHFVMKISSSRLADYAHGVSVKWRLPSVTKTLVEGYFEAFTTLGLGGRKAALIGAGRELFSVTPEPFQQAIWQLAALPDPRPRSIFVITSEPYIPWELMIPNDGASSLPALGVHFALGRWVHKQHVAAEQAMPIVDSYVIAPNYRGSKKLNFSAAEAQYVIDAFDGTRIDPALIHNIDQQLAQRGATLLHLICHGTNTPSGQIIALDPDDELREIMLTGLAGVVTAVDQAKPFVFINACEVGRIAPALVGTGGFASRFIALGARCVIAPIWSVKDGVAATVAPLLYDEVRANPAKPFAEIMCDIRRRAYEGLDPEDSYAAYCFFGDPLAAQVPA